MASISQFVSWWKEFIDRITLPGIFNFLLILVLFLLPWQTRWIYNSAHINGEFWEYGSKSLYGTEIFVWLIIILFTFNFYRKKDNIKKINVRLVFIVLFIVVLGITVFTSLDKNISFEFMFHFLEAICLGIVIVVSTTSFKKIGLALWSGGVVQGILALVQFFTQEIWANKWLGMARHIGGDLGAAVIETSTGRWLRAYGSFGWPNSLGIYLAVVWVLGFILYFTIQNKKYRAIITGGQLIILSGLILSFSRGAWLAAGGGIIILFYCVIASEYKRASQSPRNQNESGFGTKGIATGRRWTTALAMTLVKQLFYSSLVIILFLIMLWPLFSARFDSTTRLEHRSIVERVSQYTQAKKSMTEHPWFGVGPGVYTLYLHNINRELSVWELQPVHNIYLLSFVEMGGFVSLLYCFIVIVLLRYIWKYNRMFLPVMVALLVAGLFDHWLWTMYTGQLLWWVGWGMALKQKESF